MKTSQTDSTNMELGFNTISLCVTDENQCSSNASLRIFLEDPIVPPATINNLIIYPNPFNSYSTIGSKSINFPVFEVDLIDGYGHILNRKMKDNDTNIRFKTSNLATGTYFLRISSNEGTRLIKITKIN